MTGAPQHWWNKPHWHLKLYRMITSNCTITRWLSAYCHSVPRSHQSLRLIIAPRDSDGGLWWFIRGEPEQKVYQDYKMYIKFFVTALTRRQRCPALVWPPPALPTRRAFPGPHNWHDLPEDEARVASLSNSPSPGHNTPPCPRYDPSSTPLLEQKW